MVRKGGTAPTVTIATPNPSPISIKVSSAFLYTPVLSDPDPGLLGCRATKICRMDGWMESTSMFNMSISDFSRKYYKATLHPSIIPSIFRPAALFFISSISLLQL